MLWGVGDRYVLCFSVKLFEKGAVGRRTWVGEYDRVGRGGGGGRRGWREVGRLRNRPGLSDFPCLVSLGEWLSAERFAAPERVCVGCKAVWS